MNVAVVTFMKAVFFRIIPDMEGLTNMASKRNMWSIMRPHLSLSGQYPWSPQPHHHLTRWPEGNGGGDSTSHHYYSVTSGTNQNWP